MTRRLSSDRFGRLADLQGLAALERRQTLADACATSDQHREREAVLAQNLETAEGQLDSVRGTERLCIDRWRLAAAIVTDEAEALAAESHALEKANDREIRLSADWMTARHRANWLTDCAHAARKKENARRDEANERESRDTRLALGKPKAWP